jgi:hypothetical protein
LIDIKIKKDYKMADIFENALEAVFGTGDSEYEDPNNVVERLRFRVPATENRDSFPRDDQWIRMSFVTVDRQGQPTMQRQELENAQFSTAQLKHTDSSIGGNLCINPPAQFTRYADIRQVGFRPDARETTLGPASRHSLGMGRYYSEAIDDNNQIIHLRFGVAQYNSLTQFFTGFYSGKMASMARSGRFDPSLFDKIMMTSGTVIGLALLPMVLIPIGFIMFGTMAKFFMGSSSSKFYSMKPTMHSYWMAVQSLVDQLTTIKGISYPTDANPSSEKILGSDKSALAKVGSAAQEVAGLGAMMPDEFTKEGTINVRAISNKSKILQIAFESNLKDAIERTKDYGDNVQEALRKIMQDNNSVLTNKKLAFKIDRVSLESYIYNYVKNVGDWAKSDPKASGEKDIRENAAKNPAKDEYVAKKLPTGFGEYFLAELADGSQWASFKVDYTGPVQESFSNSVTPSSLASKFNSTSKSARDKRINLADGNITDALGGVVDGIKLLASSAAAVLHIDGLAAFAGNAFIDIPDNWESSTASLPRSTYTITLTSPYGNPISQMMNIYVPLAMLLAGALPLATGKQSHTSPFLCELHDRGRCMTRLGIIDSMTITRGSGNLGFNNEGKAMAIDVSFSIKDLSSIVSMPITPSFSLMPADGLFDSENSFTDYLMAMSGTSLGDAIYRVPMLKRQITRIRTSFNNYFSSAGWASWAANLPGVNLLGAAFRGTDKN